MMTWRFFALWKGTTPLTEMLSDSAALEVMINSLKEALINAATGMGMNHVQYGIFFASEPNSNLFVQSGQREFEQKMFLYDLNGGHHINRKSECWRRTSSIIDRKLLKQSSQSRTRFARGCQEGPGFLRFSSTHIAFREAAECLDIKFYASLHRVIKDLPALVRETY